MASQELCSVEELAELLRGKEEEIISEWRRRAGELLEELHLDKATLTDHVPDLISEILHDLLRWGKPIPESDLDSPPAHGVQRFHDGLDAGEVVAEYNLLRTAFTTVAERHGLFVVGEGARIINNRIDEGVKLAITAFTAQQAVMRKKQEDEHLAFFSHDLRTPLNAISLLVEELQYVLDKQALEQTQEIFEIIQRNVVRVESLVKRVLDSKLEAPGISKSFHPQFRTFELRPLVQRLIRDLKSVALKDVIEVINEIPPQLTVYADAGLITQVFQNLLTNAFKYAGQGRVNVNACLAGTTVTCVVRDNGAGIPADMLDKVFDIMATDPGKSGTGLGLTIVKQIVEAHGGTVTVESVFGEGAAFIFTLPNPPEATA